MNIEYTENEIRILENDKEIVMWTKSEWEEDSEIVFSIANAIQLAMTNPKKLKTLIN